VKKRLTAHLDGDDGDVEGNDVTKLDGEVMLMMLLLQATTKRISKLIISLQEMPQYTILNIVALMHGKNAFPSTNS
jgi:hypothetical protein